MRVMKLNCINQLLFVGTILALTFVACGNENNENYNQLYTGSKSGSSKNSVDGGSESGCKFSNGSHSATVDYSNPETGVSNTYSLEFQVENCKVTEKDFPNGGW